MPEIRLKTISNRIRGDTVLTGAVKGKLQGGKP